MNSDEDPAAPPSTATDAQWAQAVAGGSPAAIFSEIVGALGRTTEAVASNVARVARRALSDSRGVLIDPLLDRLRTGGSLREDLISLLQELAGNDLYGGSGETSPETTTDPAVVRSEGAQDKRVLFEREQIEQAIAEGVREATEAGTISPSQDSDVVAWALTSLIITLAVRAREGDDTDRLVAVATAAMEDLLLTGPSGTAESTGPTAG